jgi:hypothetical protein
MGVGEPMANCRIRQEIKELATTRYFVSWDERVLKLSVYDASVDKTRELNVTFSADHPFTAPLLWFTEPTPIPMLSPSAFSSISASCLFTMSTDTDRWIPLATILKLCTNLEEMFISSNK